MATPSDLQSRADEFCSSIVKDIILSIVTCGIYLIFWQMRQIRALNYLLGEEKYSSGKWFLLTIVTCGVYHFYHEYVTSQSIVDIQRKFGKPESANLPALGLVLTFLGGGIITDVIQQTEINKVFGR